MRRFPQLRRSLKPTYEALLRRSQRRRGQVAFRHAIAIEPSRIQRALLPEGTRLIEALEPGGQVLSGDWDRSIELDRHPEPTEGQRDQPAHDEEPITVVVDRHGRIVLAAAAQAWRLHDGSLPTTAEVAARHSDWADFCAEVHGYLGDHDTVAYQPILHPDLADIGSAHGDQRLDLILPHLPTPPATVIDLGCQWGYFCVELSKRGYRCRGIEVSERSVYFASSLARAAEVDVSYTRASIFAEPLGSADVVLALSLFHHFLKRRESLSELEGFLARLDTEVLVFQPHLSADEGMHAAHWNPEPSEFASWVAERSRMSVKTSAGTAEDGRPVYVLTRSTTEQAHR